MVCFDLDVSALCTETRPETGTPPSSWQDCARRLATAVSAYFTGPFPSHTLFESEAKAIMKARDVGYLPLSCLHIGLTRHRAMVFKACCDRLGLPCQLHRTRIDGRICSWTLLLADGQAHFVDLTYFPGYLVPVSLWPAYLRLEHTPPVGVCVCWRRRRGERERERERRKRRDLGLETSVQSALPNYVQCL
jgi:hypothetical protein